MKSSINYIMKFFLLFVALLALGTVLLVAVYMLPTGTMCENVSRSADIMREEGNYPLLDQNCQTSKIDNWTDSLMLMAAAFEDDAPDAVNAMLAPHYSFTDRAAGEEYPKLPAENLVCIYGDGVSENIEKASYGRYWHGYLLFLKPLLLVTDYGGVRTLICLSQLLLVAVTALCYIKKGRAAYLIPILALYLFLNPFALSKSMQYNDIFMLCFLQLPLILMLPERYAERRLWPLHFLAVGCLTSYFDFLTYPLIAFGVPMLMLLVLYPDSPLKDFAATVKSGLSWAAAYVGFTVSKWLVGSVITGTDFFPEALSSFALRSVGTTDDGLSGFVLRYQAIYRNLSTAKLALGITLAVLLICFAIALIKKKHISFPRLVIYGCFMAAPLLWYAVMPNHSYLHSHFAFRTLGLTVFAAFMLMIKFFSKEDAYDCRREKI